MTDTIFRGNVVTENGVLEDGYLAVRDGKILSVSTERPALDGDIEDHAGRWIFPGMIDAQVHARSQKGREGFDYCTRAAAAGGVTMIVDMPYDEGFLVCSGDRVRQKAAEAEAEAHVDVALYGTIDPEDGVARMAEQVEAGVIGFKFSTFGAHPKRFPRIPPYLMARAFAEVAKSGLAAGVHNENDEVVRYEQAEVDAVGLTDYTAHGLSHTPLSELLAMAEIYEIGAHAGCRAHVVHCSLGRGIDICTSYKAQGFDASVEVCIHYLLLSEEDDVSRLVGLGKINPPIRRRAEREALWQRLAEGQIDLVSTDHVAWSLDRKNDPNMLKNASGGPSLEVIVPGLIKACLDRGLDLSLAAKVLAGKPARHFCIDHQKGALEPGRDADFCIIDPATTPYRCDSSQTVSDWSAYEGMELPRVMETYLRGQQVWDGETVTQPSGYGRFVRPASAELG